MDGKKPLELYIHIPFCIRKCLYCDFLSFSANRKMQAEYMDQLRSEIKYLGFSYQEYQVTTIFIGGGTPSSLEGEEIFQLMQAVYQSFSVAEDAEITIEANPGTQLAAKLPVYRRAGINRVSLGLQSACDKELHYLGRIHCFDDFLLGFQQARMAGFSNINVDLMSGIPGQTEESWKNTLRRVVMLKPEHISAYSLILEEGTPLGIHYQEDGEEDPLKGWPPVADEEEDRRMYHLTKTILAEAGFSRYEISNYARPGFACRHNIGYWTGKEYLGIGLGASSYTRGYRYSNETDIYIYLDLDFSADGLEKLHGTVYLQSQREKMEEFMFLGLRMTEGVSNARFFEEFGISMDTVYQDVITKMVEQNLLVWQEARLSLTELGMDVSNYVMSEFLLEPQQNTPAAAR